jgi:hypothetical protein
VKLVAVMGGAVAEKDVAAVAGRAAGDADGVRTGDDVEAMLLRRRAMNAAKRGVAASIAAMASAAGGVRPTTAIASGKVRGTG